MRRTVLLLASIPLAVLLASGVALAAANTFSNPSRITVPVSGAATPYPSAVSVSGLGAVTDVDLKLNGFSHTYPDDVQVELVGPSGASVTVMSDVGGGNDVSNIDLTLDDEATATLPDGQLSGGAYKPTSPLSAFDGTDPNGKWELYVEDTSGGDSGSFSSGWSLTITSEGTAQPPPPDTNPPDTRLTHTPPEFDSNVNPALAFRSSETGSTFECKLDNSAYQTCTAPKKYFLLPEGQHTFAVRAKDAANNADPTPAEHTWTVDSISPKVAFTQRPGTATGPSRWDDWVTDDRSPSWAWTVEDPNLNPATEQCELYDDTNERYIIDGEPCFSTYTFEGELPDGHYYFEVGADDTAGNSGSATNYFEVDTVAPKVVSGKPTGGRASTYGTVTVTFDDEVHNSKQFVNIYKGGSNTPLALRSRDEYGKKIVIDTKKRLKPGTSYTVKVTTGVNDGANNLEAPYSWTFKTKK